MGMVTSIAIYYFSFFVSLYGGIWMFRRISKSLRRRRDARKHRARLQEMALEMVNGEKAHIYNRRASDRLIRTVTKKSKYN